ncbi:MAG: M1 family metallopeptidase [Cytophagales bacterium]|nr:M1 family metallopeptidase [Cytophagales bacterium]
MRLWTSLGFWVWLCFLGLSGIGGGLWAQQPRGYWQQAVRYEMDVSLDEKKHLLSGRQRLFYTNHSPDTLSRLFYHLYFNAFQPNSMMDVRSRSISDPDPRVGNRIYRLKKKEQGYQRILRLRQDGEEVGIKIVGTLAEVILHHDVFPDSTTVMDMDFEAKIPVQIRRAGRNNVEGISYSMSQWYPKLAAYDALGWHTTPYVAREFYGVWGDFEVKITLNKKFIVAGTGKLKNPEEIGHGYVVQEDIVKNKDFPSARLVWHFEAKRVHDFVWAADPDYQHETVQVPGGPLLRFFYQKERHNKKSAARDWEDSMEGVWGQLQSDILKAFPFIENHFGKYPYENYSFIQGGDGGMEYPMATLITGERTKASLRGVALHELMHSWYQGVLATNESRYAWVDEGFTSHADHWVEHSVFGKGQIEGDNPSNFLKRYYKVYAQWTQTGSEERMNTWADHFKTNQAYVVASYVKGAIFQQQLVYILGWEVFRRGLLRYYDIWKFKNPSPEDYIRVLEKESGLKLGWYYEYFVNTTHWIDYGIKEIRTQGDTTEVEIVRIGEIPMPLEIRVILKDGDIKNYYIPLQMMRGEKALPSSYERLAPSRWTDSSYSWQIPFKKEEIERIILDPDGFLADVNRKDNLYTQ